MNMFQNRNRKFLNWGKDIIEVFYLRKIVMEWYKGAENYIIYGIAMGYLKQAKVT